MLESDYESIRNELLEAVVRVSTGELCSLRALDTGREYMWGGALPRELQRIEEQEEARGKQYSDFVMFPIVGPVKEDRIWVDGVAYPMVQHGLSRHLPWRVEDAGKDWIELSQGYDACQELEDGTNARFPRSFRMDKRIALEAQHVCLDLLLRNLSDLPLPFAVGEHPLFYSGIPERSRLSFDAFFDLGLTAVHEIDGNVYVRRNCQSAILYNKDASERFSVELGPSSKSERTYENLMVWSPRDQPYVGLEPFTSLATKDHVGEFSDAPGIQIINPNGVTGYGLEIAVR